MVLKRVVRKMLEGRGVERLWRRIESRKML
jgi:hypothetical protein